MPTDGANIAAMLPVVQSRDRRRAAGRLLMGFRTPANSLWKVLRRGAAGRSLGEVSRRLPAISLICAALCASGTLLDMAQVFAWTRMFAGYARNESIAAAARETFDPAKPCALCCAVS